MDPIEAGRKQAARIHAEMVDALPHAGGQCAELYADKPIYDVPGLPVCSGRELIERLQQQIRPFAPTLHLSQEVTALKALERGIARRSRRIAAPFWVPPVVSARALAQRVIELKPLPHLVESLEIARREVVDYTTPQPSDGARHLEQP